MTNHKVSLSKPISIERIASVGEEVLCLLSCRYKKVGRPGGVKKEKFERKEDTPRENENHIKTNTNYSRREQI